MFIVGVCVKYGHWVGGRGRCEKRVWWCFRNIMHLPSLKLTFSHLKIGLLKRKLVFKRSIFTCYVSFREGIYILQQMVNWWFGVQPLLGKKIQIDLHICWKTGWQKDPPTRKKKRYRERSHIPPGNKHIPYQSALWKMIFPFPFGGICDRSLEGIPLKLEKDWICLFPSRWWYSLIQIFQVTWGHHSSGGDSGKVQDGNWW